MATDAATAAICTVCRGAIDAPMSAECNWCNAPFHLNQRNDVEAQDCGEVWIDEQHLALQFACNTCLAGDAGPIVAARQPAPTTAPRLRAARDATRPRRYKKRL